MNYFTPQSAAGRFAIGRPYFHPIVVGRIKDFFLIKEPLPFALDVGCGTGLSTVALKALAEKVAGIDASAAMVALAPNEKGVGYFVGCAEELPFRENQFEIMTLSQAFHWLDRDKFFEEASRVLRPGGWLVVYDNYFSGRIAGNSVFEKFYGEYLKNYPITPRAKTDFTPENTNPYGFDLLREERFENTVDFDLEGLVDYLVTQSNVIARVEGGDESIDEVCKWLKLQLKPVFKNRQNHQFIFNAPIWYLQLNRL